MCGFIVRDIMRPEHDVVRQTYDDDPDGGVFNDAPDREPAREVTFYPTG